MKTSYLNVNGVTIENAKKEGFIIAYTNFQITLLDMILWGISIDLIRVLRPHVVTNVQ